MSATAHPEPWRPAVVTKPPAELWGGWEFGILLLMAGLYLGGVFVNPAFFGTTDALAAVLRDTARYGVMAVGMTFVIVNRELDLSIGSTLGLVSTLFSVAYAPSHADADIWTALAFCVAAGLAIGLVNGVLVTFLRVPAFIATLSTLFIGRGLVLGLSGGNTIAFGEKAAADPWFFRLGETNALGFNNQIAIFAVVALLGAIALGKTRAGYETASVGGNEQAARYAGIATTKVRIRSYVISALSATLAGLMNVAQDKGITSQNGQGAELIVIAAVIVGGASIAGGRGRVLGSCLGAALTVLIDKVLREGVPITRTVDVGGVPMEIGAVAQLPPGAVPAFLGLLLVGAVLIEPWATGGGFARLRARLSRRPLPVFAARGDAAATAAQTRTTTALDRALAAKGAIAAFLARRDAAAILLVLALWLAGLALRPDFWAGLDNSFAMLTAFTESRHPQHRSHLRHRGGRHRPLGRLGAGARGGGLGLLPEGARALARHGGVARAPFRARLRRAERDARHQVSPAVLRRDALDLLHRARPRGLAGGGTPGFRAFRKASRCSAAISPRCSPRWASRPQGAGGALSRPR